MTDDRDRDGDPWAAPPLSEGDDPWTQPDPAGTDRPASTDRPGSPDADPWLREPPGGPPAEWRRPPPPRPGTERMPLSINTGLPASLPASPPGWEAGYPDLPPESAYPSRRRSPGFAPADPAAVSGPPWPVLVASAGYAPPRLITWPIFAGCGLLVAYIVAAIALAANSSPTTPSQASWLLRHDATISTLNADQAAISNTPMSIPAWQKLRSDAEAAATLPSPGGAATVPWREMLNDYVNAATDVLQAEQNHNPTELQEVGQILAAANAAAQRFNAALESG